MLERLGDEYEPVENKDANEQTTAHLEAIQPLLRAYSRHIATKVADPDLFPGIEAATNDFTAPDGWSKRWWDVPFSSVLDALFRRWREAVTDLDSEALPAAVSVVELRAPSWRRVSRSISAPTRRRASTENGSALPV